MFPFFALIPPTLFVILLVVAIYGIAAWRRRRVDDEADPGIGTVRRLYFYIVSFVALMMASNGIVLLIRTLLCGPHHLAAELCLTALLFVDAVKQRDAIEPQRNAVQILWR